MLVTPVRNPKAPKLDALLRERRADIVQLAAKHGAYNVRVFGSVARGEADEDSDIDFPVDFEHGKSLLDWAGLWLDLQDMLKSRVDLGTPDSLKPRVRDRILSEAVSL